MALPAEQAPVAALLHRLTGAEPIETHISAVYVGPDRVLKLKKAVDLGFLDFSTLARRETFCRREYALNVGAAPGIYRGVWPVTEAGQGRLELGGQGKVLDWVVEMAPLPADGFFDVLAREGRIDGDLAEALGEAVFQLHQSLAPEPEIDPAAALARVVAGNIHAARAARLPEAPLIEWQGAIGRELERLGPLMRARAERGFVRRCHGDLHLGNIVMWDGHPTPFDALEFNEEFALIDVGYDLAFLLMDCDHRVGRTAANRVMNRYLARGGDVGLLPLLPFWLSLRALIRAHCEARAGKDGLSYLRAALDYLRPRPPRLVAVGGLQGTGKSWLARRLAPMLGRAPGALHLRSDEIRKRLWGVPPERKLPREAYAETVSRQVYDEQRAMAEAALEAGQSVIVDAVFLDPTRRDEIAALARGVGAAFDGLWLQAPMALLEARVAARRGDASDADIAVLRAAAKADPGPLSAWQPIDAAGAVLEEAISALALPPPSAC